MVKLPDTESLEVQVYKAVTVPDKFLPNMCPEKKIGGKKHKLGYWI